MTLDAQALVRFLSQNPLLLLFIIAAVSYPLGRLKIKGVGLGVSAVLFVALAVGALDPNLRLPEIIYTLGLVIFVYTIGLSSGPGFFASFRRKGLRDNALAAVLLVFAAVLIVVIALLLDLSAPVAAGMYTGALTNTPALAAVIEYLTSSVPAASDQLLAEPVLGYSIAYPIGFVGVIVVIVIWTRLWRVDYQKDAERVRDVPRPQTLIARTVRVTSIPDGSPRIQELMATEGWDVLFGRRKHAGQLALARGDMRLEPGDLVTVVGAPDQVERVRAALGEFSDEALELDRSEMDYRRVFVSNPQVVGIPLRDLNLPQQFGALVTRVRRGDVEFLAHDDTVLELGDRVRVVTRRENMDVVSRFFGDSWVCERRNGQRPAQSRLCDRLPRRDHLENFPGSSIIGRTKSVTCVNRHSPQDEEEPMAVYISLINLTEEGMKTIKDDLERVRAASRIGEHEGVKLLAEWWTMGQYDAVMITEAPDDETISRFLLGAGRQGYIRTVTMRAFTPDEIAGIISGLA